MSHIELRDVNKSYISGKVTVRALSDVNLSINTGELIAITGTSGSGKSTLLQLIGLLDKPSNGEVFFDGQPTSKLSDNSAEQFAQPNNWFCLSVVLFTAEFNSSR